MISQFPHNYVVSYNCTLYNFLVTRIVRMIHAKNYEKLSKFVKVTAKILSVPFSGHSTLCSEKTPNFVFLHNS